MLFCHLLHLSLIFHLQCTFFVIKALLESNCVRDGNFPSNITKLNIGEVVETRRKRYCFQAKQCPIQTPILVLFYDVHYIKSQLTHSALVIASIVFL